MEAHTLRFQFDLTTQLKQLHRHTATTV